MKLVIIVLTLISQLSFASEIYSCKVTHGPNIDESVLLPSSRLPYAKVHKFTFELKNKNREALLMAFGDNHEVNLGTGKLSIGTDSELITFENSTMGHFFEISKINHSTYQGYISIYSQVYYDVTCKKIKNT
jgi:hypothetical protein